MDKRVKILSLGTDDNRLRGHVYSFYEQLPADRFDKRLIVFETLYNHPDYAFIDKQKKLSPLEKFKRSCFRKRQRWARDFHAGGKFKRDKQKDEYCFYTNDFVPISAQDILDKCKGFKPDIISIHWVAGFVTSKTIRELHELTGAKILFAFVDEAHMTGGCHYPVDCAGYKSGCKDCPAIKKGKKLAAIQLERKLRFWNAMPKIVMATPYDCRLAKQTELFKDAKFINWVDMPEIPAFPKDEARANFGIRDGEFVVMMGANYLYEKRKGVTYSAEAIRLLASRFDNVCVLVPGNKKATDIIDFGKARVIAPGFLSFEDLCAAYCAADCFLSTTIADSGPMMINFAITERVPVVSFDLGIAQDLVLHKQTGYIAKMMDSEDVAAGLEYIYHTDKEFFSTNCKNITEKYRNLPSAMQQLDALCFSAH